MRRATIGLRMHSGWGALVAVSNDPALEVIDRRHIVVADRRISGSKQPYHHAEKLGLEPAENYLANCSAASRQLASSAMCELIQDLLKLEYRVSGAAILMASGRKLPPLTEILASHALIHAAEGEFFRRMVHQACADAGIAVTQLRERELADRAGEVLGDRVDQVKRRIASFGKCLGPPWTQDEKLAALAATLVLAL